MVEIQTEDHLRRWPSDLLIEELDKLINSEVTNWASSAETLLDDAFEDSSILELFNSIPDPSQNFDPSDPWYIVQPSSKHSLQLDFLKNLRSLVPEFPESTQIPKLFTERKSGSDLEKINRSFDAMVNDLNIILEGLSRRGYFEKIFGPDCIDRMGDGSAFEKVIENHSGAGLTWPLDVHYYQSFGHDYLYNALEILDYYVAAPTKRNWHGFGEPHWDYYHFSRRRGRAIYRWEINRVLSKYESQYEMGVSGDSAGKIIENTLPEMSVLVQASVENTVDFADATKVAHAISLFRERNGGMESKRSACITLASILENRRNLLKENLLSKDEGALFQLANEFHIRHDNERQKRDYDSVFLEWVFWWYLATIDLSNKLLNRENLINGERPDGDKESAPPF